MGSSHIVKSDWRFKVFPKVKKRYLLNFLKLWVFFIFFLDLFTEDDAKLIIQKIDLNNDGIIEWTEFLKVISDWLNNFTNKEEVSESESQTSSTPIERKKFHDKISKFFYQFKSDMQIFDPNSQDYERLEDLENRSDEWNFQGEKILVPAQNKVFLYSFVLFL